MKRWYDRKAMQKNDIITEFLDGNLSSKERADLESGQMKATLESLKRLQVSLKNLPRVKTSDSFDAVLRARIRHEMRHSLPLQRFFSNRVGWRVGGYSAAASLFIALGIVLGKVILSPAGYVPAADAGSNAGMITAVAEEQSLATSAEPVQEQALTNYVIEHVVSTEIENLPRYTISSEGKREFEQVLGDSLRNRKSVRTADRALIRQASQSVQF